MDMRSDYETVSKSYKINGLWAVDYEYIPRPRVMAFLSSEPRMLKPTKEQTAMVKYVMKEYPNV